MPSDCRKFRPKFSVQARDPARYFLLILKNFETWTIFGDFSFWKWSQILRTSFLTNCAQNHNQPFLNHDFSSLFFIFSGVLEQFVSCCSIFQITHNFFNLKSFIVDFIVYVDRWMFYRIIGAFLDFILSIYRFTGLLTHSPFSIIHYFWWVLHFYRNPFFHIKFLTKSIVLNLKILMKIEKPSKLKEALKQFEKLK